MSQILEKPEMYECDYCDTKAYNDDEAPEDYEGEVLTMIRAGDESLALCEACADHYTN